MKVIKETPLSELILRKYEKPETIKGRTLVKKFVLSVGLLQPGDSRDVIVDVLYVILKSKKELTAEGIVDAVVTFRKKKKLEMIGIASSNIRRQIRRLKELFLIEKNLNKYRVNENAKLSEIFEEKIEKFMLRSITERVKEYTRKIDEEFKL